MIYTKEYLIKAFLSRFQYYNHDTTKLEKLASDYYDKVGKDKFRISTKLDAAALRDYKTLGHCNI